MKAVLFQPATDHPPPPEPDMNFSIAVRSPIGRHCETNPGEFALQWGRRSGCSGKHHYSRVVDQREAFGVRVEAAIGDRMLVSEDRHQRKDRLEVVLLTRSQAGPNRSTQSIDHGGELRVDASLRPADRLERLPTRRVGSVLARLDVRAIKMPQLPRRIPGKLLEELPPEATRTPSSPSRIDRSPRTKAVGQISPRHPGAKHIPDRRDHEPVVLSRAPSNVTRWRLRTLDFAGSIFLAAPRTAAATPIDL